MWRRPLLSKHSFLSVRLIHDKIHVAIIGSGPAGSYTAKYLLSHFDKQQSIHKKSVDITLIERLPTPFGLVRSGIAPDHPEVKNVEHEFTALFHKYHPQKQVPKENMDPNNPDDDYYDDSKASTLAFRGNVPVGDSQTVTWKELTSLFHIVVFAYGCADADVPLLQQDDSSSLKGIFSAREFVAWYNGHPMYAHSMTSKLQECFRSSHNTPKRVVIIGHGNVALDCARILAKGSSHGSHALWDTDITHQAFNVLSDTPIQSIHILGRRGHVQSSFTIKELRELITLKGEGYNDVNFVVYSDELDLGMTSSSIQELESSKPKTRIDKLLREQSVIATSSQLHQERMEQSSNSKMIELRFLLNPVQFRPHPTDKTRIGSVLCQRTLLQGPAGKQIAVGRDNEFIELPADVVLVSIGYRGLALLDMDESMFDYKRGILKNVKGRVVVKDGSSQTTGLLYAVGWIKRGPTGIIGTNIPDAKETVQSIIEDLDHHQEKWRRPVFGRQGLDELLLQRSVQFVDFQDYLLIDQKEKDPSRLRSALQPREKITSLEEMLSIISSERSKIL